MRDESLDIVAPVVIVVGAGFVAVKTRLLAAEPIDHLMRFAITFAIPCLLFRATSTLDLAAAFDWRILVAYYGASIACFVIAYAVARKIFKRRPGESVAIAFAALFSNLVLLGLPILERASDLERMSPGYALVAVNAPICYLLGITAMEYLRADGRGVAATTRIVVTAIFRNSIMIGIGLGLAVNVTGLPLPHSLIAAIDLLARASLPVALFALGGVLTRYRLSQSLGEAGTVAVLTLAVQPAFTLLLARLLGLPESTTTTIVLMSAVAPGLNAYLFAAMYDRAVDVAASAVLLSTGLAVFSVSAWLIVL